MLMVCQSCGKSFEVAGHLEAEAASKCPACGYSFGGEEKKAPQPPRTRRPTSPLLARGKTKPVPKKTRLLSKKELARAPRLPESVDVGKCELGQELSRSGAGVLYAARDAASGAGILVKAFLDPAGSQAQDSARWAERSREAMRLRHPRLVRVLGVGVLEGVPCAAIERVDGMDFEDALKKRPAQLKFGAQVVLGVLEGLEAAHAAGVVHGDVKPSNILVDREGRGRLTDFGHSPRAVRSDGSVADSEHARSSLFYTAPELLSSAPEAVAKTADIYSVGAVLYRLVTGKAPYSDLPPEEQLDAIREGRLRPPKPASRLAFELQAIAELALDRDPSGRYRTVRELAADLRRFMSARSIRAVRKRRRGRRVLKAALWGVLLAALAVSSYYAYSDRRRNKAEKRAAALLDGAALSLAAGDQEQAERLLLETLALPTGKLTAAAAHRELGTCLLDLGRYGDAADAFLQAAAREEGFRAFEAEAMAEVARALGGEPERARDRLLGLSAKAPVAGMIAEAARRLAAAGKAGTAAEFYEAFRSSDAPPPERADALIAYARMKVAGGAYTDARGLLLEAVGLDGGSKQRAALALAQVAPVDLSGEEKDLLLASAEAMTAIAESFREARRPGEARTWFERALAAAKDERLSSRASAGLGELAELGGDLPAARSRFMEVVEKSSADEAATARARLGLARLDLRKGEAARALPVLRQLAEELGAAEATEARLLAAFCLRATGVPSEAARLYAKVADERGLEPEFVLRALLGRAEALLESGSRKGAAGILARAVAEAPPESRPGRIAAFLQRGMGAEELEAEAESWPRDERAHALYAVGLALEPADEMESRDAYSRCVEASGEVSWYRVLARSRSRRRGRD